MSTARWNKQSHSAFVARKHRSAAMQNRLSAESVAPIWSSAGLAPAGDVIAVLYGAGSEHESGFFIVGVRIVQQRGYMSVENTLFQPVFLANTSNDKGFHDWLFF